MGQVFVSLIMYVLERGCWHYWDTGRNATAFDIPSYPQLCYTLHWMSTICSIAESYYLFSCAGPSNSMLNAELACLYCLCLTYKRWVYLPLLVLCDHNSWNKQWREKWNRSNESILELFNSHQHNIQQKHSAFRTISSGEKCLVEEIGEIHNHASY